MSEMSIFGLVLSGLSIVITFWGLFFLHLLKRVEEIDNRLNQLENRLDARGSHD